MNRYGRDFSDRGSRGGRYDAGFGASRRGGSGRMRGYDSGFADVRGRPPQHARGREEARGRDGFWYPNPNRSLTGDFGDFNSQGRFGGYWGATNLRPMMAGYDVEMRRGPGRGR